MAEIRATKDHFERETEETERLVRPSPKVKPPRRDLRRERIEVDDEPEKHDKEAGARVLGRWLRQADESPKVLVRHRETGQTREVTKEFLQSEHGRAYEPVREGEGDESDQKDLAKPEGPGSGEPKPPAKEEEPKHEDKRKRDEKRLQALHALNDDIEGDLAFESLTKSILDPKSVLSGYTNDTPLSRMPKQIIDPEAHPAFKEFETMGDLRQALHALKHLDKVEAKLRERWKSEDAKSPPKEEEAKPEPPKAEEPKAEEKPSEKPTEAEGPTGGPPLDPAKESDLATSGSQIREMAKSDPAIATFVKQLDSADPASFIKLRQKMNPGEEIAAYLRGAFPKNVKTIGDFMNALKLSEPKAEEEAPKEETPAAKGEEKPGEETKAPEAAPEKPAEKAPEPDRMDRLLAVIEKLVDKPKAEKKEKPKSDKAKDEHPKVKPSEDEEAVASFIRSNKHKEPDFQDWADEDSSTIRDDSGEMLFPDEKRKKHVPFDKLPPRAQADWVDRFQRSKSLNENIKGLREKSITDSNLARTLKDLANPKSELRQRLKESGGRLEYQSIKKSIPELRDADLPPGVKTVGDLLSAAAEMHRLPPQPSRRETTPEEEDKAKRQIIENLPADAAERLLEMEPPLHPDDVRELVEAHSMAMGEKNDKELLKAIEGHYETDPEKVRPPAKGVNRHGEEVPFEKLSEGEKADAMQKHRMFVLGMSLAAREKQVQILKKKTNAPDELLGHIADFSLSKHPHETPEDREARAEVAAKHVFKDAIQRGLMEEDADRYARWQQKRNQLIEQHQAEAKNRGEEYDESEDKALPRRPAPKEITEKQVKKLLDQLKDDPASQRIAVGYAQANDYLRAQREYLSPDSPQAISEHQSPKEIVKGLKKIDQFFADADKRYPESMRGAIPAKEHFRNRILEKVRNLSPEKYPFVNAYVKEQEYDEYEQKLKTWGKEYDKAVAKHKKTVGHPYREGEPPPIDLPEPPRRPTGYGQSRSDPTDIKDHRRHLYDRLKDQGEALKTASTLTRVVARARGDSTCKRHWAMGDPRSKAAVYWGVEPYPKDKAVNTPYVPWTQAHQRDLSERDFSALLKSAREWLKAPVLSTAVDGIYRDTQLRAALDLAIRDHEGGRYSVGLQPPIYNELLARLGGAPEGETLLTDRSNISGPITVQTASGSLYARRTGEGHPMKASTLVRKFAAKYASTNPTVAYDLIDLSTKIAEQEGQEEQQSQQKQAQLPPEFLEHQKGKKEDDKDQGQGQGQQKEASYTQLRSAVIKMAAANPHLLAAYRPLLETIKKLG